MIVHDGLLYSVLELITQYETANWAEVSRLMVLQNINMDSLSGAYLNALQWYKKLMYIEAEK